MRSQRSSWLWNGLGLLLVVGAVLLFPVRLSAQVTRDTITKRPDSVRIPIAIGADSLLRDSLAQRDSAIARMKRDTIKAPMTRSEAPIDITIGQRVRWNRDSIYTTGAITLADLLERIPGITTFRAGWIAAPANAGYLGDFRSVRVFFDGIEMPALDPRSGGALDLTQVPIWSAEDVVIEQAPEEIRVHIRTWRVRLTTPVTRTDVTTGDQQTNLYRGYFGKRYRGGGVLQFAAQQYGTTPPSYVGNSADQLGMMLRGGWGGRRWSIDAVLLTSGRHRGVITTFPLFTVDADSINTLESTRLDGYVRIGTGDPDTSLVWAQAMAVGTRYSYTGVRTFTGVPTTAAESLLVSASLDTSNYRTQYIATGGVGRGPLRLSATGRLFAGAGQTLIIPSARASFNTRPLRLSAFAEVRGVDSVTRADVTAELSPWRFISVIGGVGIASNHQLSDSSFTTRYARGEVGLRLFDLWFTGGVMLRDSARIAPPIVFDTLFAVHQSAAATALTAGIRGRLWHFVKADVSGLYWTGDSPLYYRPRYQTRSELFVETNLLNRFPSGNFGLKFSAVHEYRSGVRFPTRGVPETIAATGYRTISTLLEIRILSATISWQFRNIMGERYDQVPFYLMPRQTNYYGVRWEFFN